MPMQRVTMAEAITKPEFHARLRVWLRDTDDRIVGPEDEKGVAAWVHVQDGGSRFKLHADTRREAVEQYLRLVDRHGDDLTWSVVESEKGKLTAVANGPDQERITPFYLYRV